MFLDCIAPKRLYSCCRGVAQLVAHRVWDAGVGGSSPPTPTGKFIIVTYIIYMKKKPTDIIIEAARIKSNGQLDFVRAYKRRGTTYSDCYLLTRSELIEQLLQGKSVASGQRVSYMASTFINIVPIRLTEENHRVIIKSGNRMTVQDDLLKVPLL
jgi:hypothetical protein